MNPSRKQTESPELGYFHQVMNHIGNNYRIDSYESRMIIMADFYDKIDQNP